MSASFDDRHMYVQCAVVQPDLRRTDSHELILALKYTYKGIFILTGYCQGRL